MKIFRPEQISPFLREPTDENGFNSWVHQEDVIPFLEQEINNDDIIIYASLPFGFIHAVLIPNRDLNDEVVEDLQKWSCNPYNTWSLVVSSEDAWIGGPLETAGSEVLSEGEQIIFARSFDGAASRNHYFELEQKISHVLQLHYIPERKAWCRLDRFGDLEDIVKITELSNLPKKETGTIITFNKNVLGEYSGAGNFILCRMFDFTRYKRGSFSGWERENKPVKIDNGSDIFGKLVVQEGDSSYSRGIQIKNISIPKEKIINDTWGRSTSDEPKQYATFTAYDWKNKRIAEISCDPSCLASYFDESELPFQVTPAFFRPEVLLKYKSDKDKYQLEDRSVTCRGAWYLKTFDVNEAGQVHTYLTYLGDLPYEEQLHWKQYNEPPKAPLSKRAIATDFEGQWYDEYDPLYSLKHKLDELHKADVGWWTLRGDNLLKRVNYPFTSSRDEWADEILNLDQLIIEGFEEKWLRGKAKELGRNPDIKVRQLKLIEECLIGIGFEEDHAYKLISPFHEVHNMRSVLKGHATGTQAEEMRKQALEKFGTFRAHFRSICADCDESLNTIIEAFQRLP